MLAGKTVKKIASGRYHACALVEGGGLYCWGSNGYGQLGDGTTSVSPSPKAVDVSGALAGKTIKDVTAYYDTTCVVASDNMAYCWGYNNLGQLGDGTTSQRSAPIPINCPTTSLGLSDNVVLGSEIKVYPNPTNAMVTISGEQEIVALVVYNLLGQEVLTKSINATETTLDVSQFPKGTYMMKLKTVNTVQTLKVIKQ